MRYIRDFGFPVILHAVFDLDDFALYGNDLLDAVAYLQMNEVIVHPVCKKAPADGVATRRLVEEVSAFSQKARKRGVIWYLENNSVIDGFHYKKEGIQQVYDADDYVRQLLDVAHIDNYEHLEQIAAVKFPECLHVAGKHFTVAHEHLPLSEGDIDYALVFDKYLKGYDGRIILEVDGTDEAVILSKGIIDKAVSGAGIGGL